MHYYVATIQYDGSEYCGFQFLPNLKTIQGEINLALNQVLKCKSTTICASRTDSGVHALQQIIKITTEKEITSDIFDLINTHLPLAIKLLSFNDTTWDFKPTTVASKKTYRYLFTNQPNSNHNPYIANIGNQLDIELIKKCLEHFLGEHDFVNFCSAGSNVSSTKRNIYSLNIEKINPQLFLQKALVFNLNNLPDECYQLEITGNGFLKQMVRHIVSSLWQIGTGKISEEQLISLINGQKSEKRNWKVAPPNGLYLYAIV